MRKIITLAQSLMQEIERYDKELIEIERVADYRWEENQQLKQENEQLKAQIEKMKCCFNCDKTIEHLDCGDCHNGSNWELAQSDKLIRS